jgi:Lrp/AsnC family transcriptional regulator of ectoine degradation
MATLKLDDRDLQILQILAREGRITKADLAKRVNLSPTPCWERLKRLEKSGVVRSYQAEIDLQRIAPHLTIFVMLELDQHKAETFQVFERMIQRFDEITACWAIGGGFDYFLQVVTRDIQSYQVLIDELLSERIGISRYFTYVVTKPVKHASKLPFDVLLGRDQSD